MPYGLLVFFTSYILTVQCVLKEGLPAKGSGLSPGEPGYWAAVSVPRSAPTTALVAEEEGLSFPLLYLRSDQLVVMFFGARMSIPYPSDRTDVTSQPSATWSRASSDKDSRQIVHRTRTRIDNHSCDAYPLARINE